MPAINLAVNQYWVSSRVPERWWKVCDITETMVRLEGPFGSERSNLKEIPSKTMTKDGFISWIRHHEAVIVENEPSSRILTNMHRRDVLFCLDMARLAALPQHEVVLMQIRNKLIGYIDIESPVPFEKVGEVTDAIMQIIEGENKFVSL